MKEPQKFIDTYSQFYFNNRIPDTENKLLGIPHDLKTADCNVEDWICKNRLNLEIYDKYSLAWKAGKISSINDNEPQFETNFETETCYRNDQNYNIAKNGFEHYCLNLNRLFDENNTWQIDVFPELYGKLQDKSTRNIGPVYIITSIFFKTRGRFPIYDRFVHRAIRALESEVSPDAIYLGTNPSKDDIRKVSCMYNEYIRLLRKIFPDEIYKSSEMFISRELDQALWVYGHCTENWYNIIENNALNN